MYCITLYFCMRIFQKCIESFSVSYFLLLIDHTMCSYHVCLLSHVLTIITDTDVPWCHDGKLPNIICLGVSSNYDFTFTLLMKCPKNVDCVLFVQITSSLCELPYFPRYRLSVFCILSIVWSYKQAYMAWVGTKQSQLPCTESCMDLLSRLCWSSRERVSQFVGLESASNRDNHDELRRLWWTYMNVC